MANAVAGALVAPTAVFPRASGTSGFGHAGARERDPDKEAKLLKASIRAARSACRLAPRRPDGHFWLAESYGEYADLRGASKALKLLPAIRHAYEAVLSIDAGYENGAAYEELGDIDIRMPSRLGGNPERGVELLETRSRGSANECRREGHARASLREEWTAK